MNYSLVARIIGRIMIVIGVLFVLPIAVSFFYDDGCATSFIIPMLILLAGGFLLTKAPAKQKNLYIGEGFLVVTFTWLLISLFSAVSYVHSGAIPSFVDALFEAVSGYTTTGASILTDIESLPRSVLFWRSFTHWIGGMGVLVFFLAINSNNETKNMYIMRAESPGPKASKIVSKTKNTARILYLIYIFLTFAEFVFLLLGGMPFFDAVTTAIATAGTGGFSIRNSSIAYYNSSYVDFVVSIFMILFGVNFTVFFLVLTGRLRDAWQNSELKWYLSIILVCTIFITFIILGKVENLADAVRQSFFTVCSTITTTGFILTDYSHWPSSAQMIIFLLMFIGGCAGSTAGGMKVIRLIVLSKIAKRELKLSASPRTVRSITVDSKSLNPELVSSIASYFILLIFMFFISTLLLSFDNVSTIEAISGVATCINNVGPGFESIGPAGNFSGLSDFSKIVLMFNMLLGRLELFPILALLTPSIWKA